jgi:hypothetical protein
VQLKASRLGPDASETLDTREILGHLRARDAANRGRRMLDRREQAERDANYELWRGVAEKSRGTGDLTRASRSLVLAAAFGGDPAALYDEALELLRQSHAEAGELGAVLVKKALYLQQTTRVIPEESFLQRRVILEEARALLLGSSDTARLVECSVALADLLAGEGHLILAEPLLRDALEAEQRMLESGHERVVGTSLQLVGLMASLGPVDRAASREMLEEILRGEKARAGGSGAVIVEAEKLRRGVKTSAGQDEELVALLTGRVEPDGSKLCRLDEEAGPKGLITLSQTARRPGTLASVEELRMVGRGLTDGVLPMFEALACPGAAPALRHIALDLEATSQQAKDAGEVGGLGPDDGAAIARALGQPGAEGLQKRLTHFEAASCRGLGAEGCAALIRVLKTYPQLVCLRLTCCGMGPAGVQSLAEALREPRAFPSLTELSLAENPLGDEGVTALADALALAVGRAGLVSLDLRRVDVGATGLAALGRAAGADTAPFARLERLGVARSEIGGVGLGAFAASLPHLPRLVEIDWSWTGAGESAVKALATIARQRGTLPNLKTLVLGPNQGVGDAGVTALAAALKISTALPQLEELDLHALKMSQKGTKALTQALRARGAVASLRELDVSRNEIGAEGATAFAELLSVSGACPRLSLLRLPGKQIHGGRFRRALIEAGVTVLKEPEADPPSGKQSSALDGLMASLAKRRVDDDQNCRVSRPGSGTLCQVQFSSSNNPLVDFIVE